MRRPTIPEMIAALETAEAGSNFLSGEVIWALYADPRDYAGDPHMRGYDPNAGRVTESLDAALALLPDDVKWSVDADGFVALWRDATTWRLDIHHEHDEILAVCIAALMVRAA